MLNAFLLSNVILSAFLLSNVIKGAFLLGNVMLIGNELSVNMLTVAAKP